MSPRRKAIIKAERLGARMDPELFLVAEAATFVVTVVNSGATVVPGMVVRASAMTVATVLLPMTVKADVVVEMTEGGIVVPGIVVVYVIS